MSKHDAFSVIDEKEKRNKGELKQKCMVHCLWVHALMIQYVQFVVILHTL